MELRGPNSRAGLYLGLSRGFVLNGGDDDRRGPHLEALVHTRGRVVGAVAGLAVDSRLGSRCWHDDLGIAAEKGENFVEPEEMGMQLHFGESLAEVVGGNTDDLSVLEEGIVEEGQTAAEL